MKSLLPEKNEPDKSLRFLLLIVLFFLSAFYLTACGSRGNGNQGNPTPTSTATAPRALTICLGQEPASLFPLNNPSSVARSVLAAVYDGPIDTNSYGYQPVILATLPSLANGDAQVFQTSVGVGDEVVDADGTPRTLAPGVMIRPAGCRSDSCAIEYDGTSEASMDQMQVTFRLLPGLTWSDGTPLTADDSVYAYELLADPALAVKKYLPERTKSYEAADDVTIQWWGKPGFIDPTYFMNFQIPLPRHLWQQVATDQLLTSEATSREPVGWGPYVIREWIAGDHITLEKNPNYFRAAEGLPKFDILVYRFLPEAETGISDLVAGACDVLDPSLNLDAQTSVLRSMAEQNQLEFLTTGTPVMEQLAFGIRPAGYDNGFNSGQDRPDFLGDARVRQAIAMCINRQEIVDTVLQGLSSVPISFVPPEYPLYNSAARAWAYDPVAANALLDQAGWKIIGSDATKPRQGWGVENVSDGTPMELTYITTGAAQRVQVASAIADDLAQCGIRVNVEYLDLTELYAAGPQGLLFGRNFELAEFGMGTTGVEPPCDWFTTLEIPNPGNYWIGTNVSGYSNTSFDSPCQTVGLSLIDEPLHSEAYFQVQALFAEELPVLPLYWRVKSGAARADMCHYSLDPTASSNMWNIEVFDFGGSCE